MVEAITEQLNRLPFQHIRRQDPRAGDAAGRELKAMVPVEDAYFFFGNSGSDANDSHYKMLRYYFNAIGKPQKRKIITASAAIMA